MRKWLKSMPKLPLVSGLELVKILKKFGFEKDHQTGSHMILRHADNPHRRLTVPNHREISRGTLRAIIRQAGLTHQQFLDLKK
jgi:predicted RNA binding protein YcfA (HicA-like mRNA interferase family)